MDGGGGDARLAQVPGHLVGPVLGAGEDQSVFHPLLLHEMGQQIGLVPLVHQVDALADHLHRGGDGIYRHLNGILQQRVHQIGDLRRHGGREKEGLLPLRQPFENLAHVVDEAHVQHPVGLVQDEDLQSLQRDEALVPEVHQPAGGGHQNVYPPLQRLHLGVLAHAAEDDGVAQLQVFAIGFKALADLDGQLPGGSENQSPDGPLEARFGLQALQNGGRKGTGLAGARLGAAQHIPPGQGGGNGLLLNGRGPLVALLLQGLQYGGAQPQVFKLHSKLPFPAAVILPLFSAELSAPARAFPCGLGRYLPSSFSRSRTTWAVWASSCPVGQGTVRSAYLQ